MAAAINVILDSLSVIFSTDENMSSFGSPPDLMTFQWSLNAWGLKSHSCGGLWDQNQGHHPSHALVPQPHPKSEGPHQHPRLGEQCHLRLGYRIHHGRFGNIRSKALEKTLADRVSGRNFSIYLNNNRKDNDGDGVLDRKDTSYTLASGNYNTLLSPLATPGAVPVIVEDPLLAFKKVASKGGALRLEVDPARPLRDEVDTRLIQDLPAQTRNHITGESDLSGVSDAGFGTLISGPAPADSDQDGMPHFWEAALGWTTSTQDHNTALPNSGGVLTGSHFPGVTLSIAGGSYTSESVTVSPGANLDGFGNLTTDLNCQGNYTARGFSCGTPGTLSISGSTFLGDSSVLRMRRGMLSDRITTGADRALAGTLPNKGTSRFAATAAPVGETEITLVWSSRPGNSYAIETNGSLTGVWTPFLTVPAAAFPATTTSQTLTRGPAKMFYRVGIVSGSPP